MKPTETDAKPSDVGVTDNLADEAENLTDNEALGIANAPVFGLAQLRDGMQKAQAVHQSLVSSETKKEMSGRWYTAQCELAQQVTYADMREDGVRSFSAEVQQFYRDMGSQLQYFEALASGAAWAIPRSESNRKGIVLAGTVQEISSIDALYKTVVKLAGKPDSVTVISRINPEQNLMVEYQTGDRLIILRSLVADPALYLRGYQGTDAKVVWGGLPVVLAVEWDAAVEAPQESEPNPE